MDGFTACQRVLPCPLESSTFAANCLLFVQTPSRLISNWAPETHSGIAPC